MNDKGSQSKIRNIMNNIVSDKKGYIIVNDSFARKPDGLLVSREMLQVNWFVL